MLRLVFAVRSLGRWFVGSARNLSNSKKKKRVNNNEEKPDQINASCAKMVSDVHCVVTPVTNVYGRC